MIPWAYPSPQPKWHLDLFSHFCTAHCRVSLHFTPTPTPLKIASSYGGSGAHLIHGSLSPPKPTTQIASRLAQPSLQGSWLWKTDRPTDTPRDSIGNNRPHLHYIVLQWGLTIHTFLVVTSEALFLTRHRASTSMYSLTFRVHATTLLQYGRNGMVHAAGTSMLSPARGVFAGMHSVRVQHECGGPGGLPLGSATHFHSVAIAMHPAHWLQIRPIVHN